MPFGEDSISSEYVSFYFSHIGAAILPNAYSLVCRSTIMKLRIKFGPWPSLVRAGTHVSMRADRERPFGKIISARRLDDEKKIVFARG